MQIKWNHVKSLAIAGVFICAATACGEDTGTCPAGQLLVAGSCTPAPDTSGDTADATGAHDTADAAGDTADVSDTADATGDTADVSDTADAAGDTADVSDTADMPGETADTKVEIVQSFGCTDETANNYVPSASTDDGSCTFDVTFKVDLSCSGETVTAPVEISGPFCDWCNTGYELADDDGDQIWEGTFSLGAGPMEFKYEANGSQIQENLLGDGSCAVVTNGTTFARRQVTISGPTSFTHTWGQCVACGDPLLGPPDLPLTFDDATVDYNLAALGGAEATLTEDPTDSGNLVLRVTKPEGAAANAGVMLGANPGLANVIPFVGGKRKLNLRVYVPGEGVVVRLRVEEANDPAKWVEAEATATSANTWEVLTFDFEDEAAGSDVFNDAYAYNQVSVFIGYGTAGADDGDAAYYVDDVSFGSGGGTGALGCTDSTANNFDAAADQDDGTCTYDITFSVDVGCAGLSINYPVAISGAFCNWCGTGYELADDDGDDVWEGTFSFGAGPLQFTYVANGYAIAEDLIGAGDCAAVTFPTYALREIMVDGPATLNIDTWGQCTGCETP